MGDIITGPDSIAQCFRELLSQPWLDCAHRSQHFTILLGSQAYLAMGVELVFLYFPQEIGASAWFHFGP